MAEEQPGSDLEFKGPGGTGFRARGYDGAIAILVIAVTGMGAILFLHMEDAKRIGIEQVTINKEIVRAVQDTKRELRFSTCINVTDPDKREAQYMQPNSFCNRVAN